MKATLWVLAIAIPIAAVIGYVIYDGHANNQAADQFCGRLIVMGQGSQCDSQLNAMKKLQSDYGLSNSEMRKLMDAFR